MKAIDLEPVLANLQRIESLIDHERNVRGVQPMGIKKAKVLSDQLEEASANLAFVIRTQIPALCTKKPKLSVQSHWLLRYLAHKGSVSISSGLPAHWSQQPDMTNARGLIRRGWAKEEMNGALISITEAGRLAAYVAGPSPRVHENQ